MGQRGRRLRPNGLFCITCLKQARPDLFADGHAAQQRAFILKLRDFIDVERMESIPCLSLCPREGISIERRGKSRVVSPDELQQVDRLFDPTRQLEFGFSEPTSPSGDPS